MRVAMSLYSCLYHSHSLLTSRPTKTNPRGIPQAPFIEKVEDIVKNPEQDFENVMKAFQDRLQQYKYMEVSKKQQMSDLNTKIPDIEKNLNIISHIKEKNETLEDSDEDDKYLETNYELNDTYIPRPRSISKSWSLYIYGWEQMSCWNIRWTRL